MSAARIDPRISWIVAHMQRHIADPLAVGELAALINLSLVGAQVVSPTILKPNQRVRFILADKPKTVRVGSVIAWAAFELPKAGPRYRAGVEFLDPDQAAVQKIIDAKRKK